MIAVIDYGMGNIHSVQKAVELFNSDVRVINDPKDLEKADKIILPGVGAFKDAMDELMRTSPLLFAIASETRKSSG